MKFLVFLSALAIECATAKSWHGDTYPDEVTWSLGWFAYLRRIFILTLLVFAIVLYYVPKSRPHARRASFIMIDIIASTIKLALGANEAELLYEDMKPEETHPNEQREVHSERTGSLEICENFENSDTPRGKRTAETVAGPVRQRRRASLRSTKEETHERSSRKSEHSAKNGIMKDVSTRSRVEYLTPVSRCSEKFVDLKKYLRSRLSHIKGVETTNLDNSIILISGNSWQMGMREKYTKSDFIILHDGYSKLDFKDSSTLTEYMPKKSFDSEESRGVNTTRQNPVEEKRGSKEYDSEPVRESKDLKYKTTNQYQSAECDTSDYSPIRFNYAATNPLPTTTVTKSTDRENETHNKSKSKETYGSIKSHDFTGQRNQSSHSRRSSIKEEESPRRSPRKNSQKDNCSFACCCTGTACCKGFLEEEDYEVSQVSEVVTANYDLDEKPQRESSTYSKRSHHDVFFDLELARLPMTMSYTKPPLLRAVDWIFGSCPGATKRKHHQQKEVGKVETQEIASGWLL